MHLTTDLGHDTESTSAIDTYSTTQENKKVQQEIVLGYYFELTINALTMLMMCCQSVGRVFCLSWQRLQSSAQVG